MFFKKPDIAIWMMIVTVARLSNIPPETLGKELRNIGNNSEYLKKIGEITSSYES